MSDSKRQLTIIGASTVRFVRRRHPIEETAYCSCCNGDAGDGVILTAGDEPFPFYFFCAECSGAIARLWGKL